MPKKKIKINLDHILRRPVHWFEKYHADSKIKHLPLGLPVEQWPQTWKTVYFKEYPRFDKVVLPPPSGLENVKLLDVYNQRASRRDFSDEPMSLEKLSSLLYYSAGVRNPDPSWQRNRFYPSPGARYPLEVYVISQNTDLPKGLYHYNVKNHCLETLLETENIDVWDYFNQDWVEKASITLIFTAVFLRSSIKYGVRGYRHSLTDAGSVGHNFYLNSAALNLKCCGIGGYVEDKLEKLLDVDGLDESVVYTMSVGT